MAAAVALDPRFCTEMNSQQKMISIKTLKNLYQHSKTMKTNNEEKAEESDEDITIENTTILNKYCNRNIVQSVSIEQLINDFIQKSHDLTNGTILDFWNSKKDEYPELYELAVVILAISPTQVTVERSFSVLSYVFNALRNQ